jgi:hypothetical protein
VAAQLSEEGKDAGAHHGYRHAGRQIMAQVDDAGWLFYRNDFSDFAAKLLF